MFWVFLEIVIALLVAVFIVWWTIPRSSKRPESQAKDKDA